MFVRFVVSNHRSLREEIELSFMYETLYTKGEVVRSITGYVF